MMGLALRGMTCYRCVSPETLCLYIDFNVFENLVVERVGSYANLPVYNGVSGGANINV